MLFLTISLVCILFVKSLLMSLSAFHLESLLSLPAHEAHPVGSLETRKRSSNCSVLSPSPSLSTYTIVFSVVKLKVLGTF